MWSMLVHFGIFAGYVIRLAGLITPILIWQIKKEQFPVVDVHGKIVVNFIISYIIYGVVAGLLVFVVIGIPLLIALGVTGVVFPIIGGIKANSGEIWPYPLTIEFLK